MGFDYYYGQEAEQFSFVKIPQVFFTDETFQKMSCEAKILYGLMLNRMNLSIKNEWLDEKNRVFIIYTVEDVMDTMACAKAKAVKIIKELEDMELIEKNRQGFGQPTLIYVKNFISKENKQEQDNNTSSKNELHEVSKSNFSRFENQTSLGLKSELDEVSKSNSKKKENISKLDLSNKNNVHTESALNKKTHQKKEADELFEKLWSLYPSKKGKGKVSDTMKKKLLTVGEEELIRAIERYKVELEKDASWRKPQNGSTFFCSGYIDYLDANYVPAENKQVKKHANSNKFHNFEQRQYDYKALEQRFINKINGIPNV